MQYESFDLDKWKSGNYTCQTISGVIVKDIIINENAVDDCYALEVKFEDCNDSSKVPRYTNYYKNGIWNMGFPGANDLILIKKENNMETKEVKIVPPEGYVIDKEQSTFECIKFKRIVRWRDNRRVQFNGWYITSGADVVDISGMFNTPTAYNVFATEKQAKSALAMARISQIMDNDERFGGPITDEEWGNKDIQKYCIIRFGDTINHDINFNVYCFLAFHTAEQRDLFLKENIDLIKDYLML